MAILVLQVRLRRFWLRARQGVVILTTPGRYVHQVAVYQLLGWSCRVAGAFFFLKAFHVEATLKNALLVQVASTLSTLVPATPGGLGPRQALLIVLLAGAASPGTVLAFGVGMELALTVWNVVIGFSALALMMRGKGLRGLLRGARETVRSDGPKRGRRRGTPELASRWLIPRKTPAWMLADTRRISLRSLSAISQRICQSGDLSELLGLSQPQTHAFVESTIWMWPLMSPRATPRRVCAAG